MTSQNTGISRRSLLTGGAAALAGGVLLGTAPIAARTAVAAEGGRFNLSVDSERWLREVAIKDETVLQSFAFDDAHSRVYLVQRQNGTDELVGDLTLTQLSYSGVVTGYMVLNGFGHGVAIGVEPAGTDAYIWTETDANPDSGYGRAIARFRFSNGVSLSPTSGAVRVFRPVSGSTSNTVSVDTLNSRIGVRFRTSAGMQYRVYDLAAFKAGVFTPLHSFAQTGVDGEVFQGWALYGDYVYQMTGTAYTSESGANPPSGHGNTFVTCVDVRNGALVQRSRTEAAYSLDFREPEGVAVQRTSPPRFVMGFASGVGGARKVSLYYKPQQ